MMTREKQLDTHCTALCPSCKQVTRFEFVGIQRWPDKVVQKTGREPSQTLHICGNCGTSVADIIPITHQNTA